MKKYKEYMDGVTVPDTLHEKLKHLEEPRKRPAPWKKYGAVAAALVLVLGLGAWGASRMDSTGELGQKVGDGPAPSIEAVTEPGIEPALDPMPNSPGMETMGGYEVSDGETVAYYMLPAIQYGEIEAPVTADFALPDGVTRRDLTEEELLALFGGESNIINHLNWGGYTVTAHAMVWPDNSLWLLYICGGKGNSGYEHFELEVMPGELPPTCLFYMESVTNHIWGREIAAERYDGEYASARRVSFMDGGYGYRFEITGTDEGAIEELVSRAARWIIAGDGLLLNQNLDVPADAPGEVCTAPSAAPSYSVGEPNFEDAPHTEPGEPVEEANTPAYDPSASGEPK